MHELSIAMSILDVAREESEQRGGVGVEVIHLKIGALSGVVKDALLFSYQLASQETAFADCRLEIEEIPVMIHCSQCNGKRAIRSLQWFACEECGTPALEVVQGRELQISAMVLSE